MIIKNRGRGFCPAFFIALFPAFSGAAGSLSGLRLLAACLGFLGLSWPDLCGRWFLLLFAFSLFLIYGSFCRLFLILLPGGKGTG